MIRPHGAIPVTILVTQFRQKSRCINGVCHRIERIRNRRECRWVVMQADLKASNIHVEWPRRPRPLQCLQRFGL